jgi:UDP-N-acetyl-D-glucosamine dehydrogenase
LKQKLKDLIETQKAVICIVGLGYVGLPLVKAFTEKSFSVVGIDIDKGKIDSLYAGKTYINHIPDDAIVEMMDSHLFSAHSDFSVVSDSDVIIICVPTPLTKHREPDLSAIEMSGRAIAPYLQKGQLVVLESSTYPGTTAETLGPILGNSGLVCGQDFYLAFSPEREDPGNKNFVTSTIPKVVGADDPDSLEVAAAIYESVISKVVKVSSTSTAEAVKLTENIFRCVNIALVNELKVIYEAMGVDVWEVIDAAATKPFGYMPFYPGPGLGGHCIPIDPYYLTYRAREFNVPTRFIELAGEINGQMPKLVVEKTILALSEFACKSIKTAKILIVGMAYKKNIGDIRESASLLIAQMLLDKGANVCYHDTHVQEIKNLKIDNAKVTITSVDLTNETLKDSDVIIICTDHSDVDYEKIMAYSKIVVDTRNATNGVIGDAIVVKA